MMPEELERGMRWKNCALWQSLIVFASCIGLAAPVPAEAQTATVSPASPQGTIIGGQTSAPSVERCVDVRIGGENAFGCINQQLRREVDRVNPSLNLPPIDARSPDVRVGNANEAAVRQQYGSNYGRSAIPYRPSTPSYVPPHR